MATVGQIREQLQVVLRRVDGIKDVLLSPPETPPETKPAVVIGEPSGQLAEGDSALGLDRWEFPLLVLVPAADYQLGSAELDAFLVRRGPKSIRQAIDENSGLGLQDGTRAYLDRVSEYGPREPGMAGAVLTLVVRTAG